MKKINVWCILVTVLFLLLGLSKVALASSQGKAKKDPDMARLEKIPAHSLSLLRPSDLAGILLLEDQVIKKDEELDKKYILVKALLK